MLVYMQARISVAVLSTGLASSGASDYCLGGLINNVETVPQDSVLRVSSNDVRAAVPQRSPSASWEEDRRIRALKSDWLSIRGYESIQPPSAPTLRSRSDVSRAVLEESGNAVYEYAYNWIRQSLIYISATHGLDAVSIPHIQEIIRSSKIRQSTLYSIRSTVSTAVTPYLHSTMCRALTLSTSKRDQNTPNAATAKQPIIGGNLKTGLEKLTRAVERGVDRQILSAQVRTYGTPPSSSQSSEQTTNIGSCNTKPII
jgi:hypothetical protein